MNKGIEEYKNNFIKEYIYDKRYIDRKEAKATKEKVYEERNGFDFKYYVKVPMEVSEEELEQFMKIKTLEKLEQINNHQSEISFNVMIAVFIIVIGFILLMFK